MARTTNNPLPTRKTRLDASTTQANAPPSKKISSDKPRSLTLPHQLDRGEEFDLAATLPDIEEPVDAAPQFFAPIGISPEALRKMGTEAAQAAFQLADNEAPTSSITVRTIGTIASTLCEQLGAADVAFTYDTNKLTVVLTSEKPVKIWPTNEGRVYTFSPDPQSQMFNIEQLNEDPSPLGKMAYEKLKELIDWGSWKSVGPPSIQLETIGDQTRVTLVFPTQHERKDLASQNNLVIERQLKYFSKAEFKRTNAPLHSATKAHYENALRELQQLMTALGAEENLREFRAPPLIQQGFKFCGSDFPPELQSGAHVFGGDDVVAVSVNQSEKFNAILRELNALERSTGLTVIPKIKFEYLAPNVLVEFSFEHRDEVLPLPQNFATMTDTQKIGALKLNIPQWEELYQAEGRIPFPEAQFAAMLQLTGSADSNVSTAAESLVRSLQQTIQRHNIREVESVAARYQPGKPVTPDGLSKHPAAWRALRQFMDNFKVLYQSQIELENRVLERAIRDHTSLEDAHEKVSAEIFKKHGWNKKFEHKAKEQTDDAFLTLMAHNAPFFDGPFAEQPHAPWTHEWQMLMILLAEEDGRLDLHGCTFLDLWKECVAIGRESLTNLIGPIIDSLSGKTVSNPEFAANGLNNMRDPSEIPLSDYYRLSGKKPLEMPQQPE